MFCRSPFERAEIMPNGDVFLCSPGWLPKPIGNLNKNSFKEIWTSDAAKDVRRSVTDGSFSNCMSQYCPYLQAEQSGQANSIFSPLENESQPKSEWSKKIASGWTPPGPSILNLAYDATCNLSCPSCRKEMISLRPGTAEYQAADRFTTGVLSALPSIRRLKVAGNGEPFASRLYWKILMAIDRKVHPDLRIQLHTNGLLFTPERWKDLEKAHGLIDSVEVSVDAATAETYAVNHRGGSFEVLAERLAFIGQLRASGEIKKLTLSFVVQANNFREMPGFVTWARQFHCDAIHFSRLADWATFPFAVLQKRSIHLPQHPEHSEFHKVLKDPVLAEPGVFLGSLSALV